MEVVKWFNNHSHALRMLHEVQQEKFGATLALILPVLMCWMSHHFSVMWLLDLELAFKKLMLSAAGDRTVVQVINILQKIRLKKYFIKYHLEPLVIAVNVTRSDSGCLDVVLGALANLYQTFMDPTLDQQVCAAVHASLEKCWAKADQPIFILVTVFNPYIQTSCFAISSPLQHFNHIWNLVQMAYV
ncbi:hypothetical protein PAXRUDRAFT_137755 [Paxillus rubicundulus Ve08.2h10]|uniref:Uncharacterized protein n=1 Tax=Paxillus rubicundulus Ve08.2h10 TaxID=930991 RepID=A0A0D0E0E1_9AGAM|nr:hypothetical protein PAXRUDRAFT_137755 [Paxillus rubicundulus Ve08.2h10]